ncbi:MAG: prolyl oligopeptidase family serine peptidase, partial [Saprospiraceae bacterium]
MTPEVYSEWHKIKHVKMSDAAEVVAYTLEKETGDSQLCFYQNSNQQSTCVSPVSKYDLDISGKYIIYTHNVSYDSLRTLKRKKTPKDKMPLDHLTIVNVMTAQSVTIEDISEFRLSKKYEGYLFYTKKMKETNSDTTAIKSKSKKEKCDETALIIRNLMTQKEDTIFNTKDYAVAEEMPVIAYAQCTGDSIWSYSVIVMDLISGMAHVVKENIFHIENISLDNKGDHLAFLGLESKSEATQKPYNLYLKSDKDTPVITLSDAFGAKQPDWVISNDKIFQWSESGKRLFFGIAPKRLVKDTTKLEEDIVNVEIWHHDSPRLYTQMESTIEQDKKKTYAVMYDINDQIFLPLENEAADRSISSVKGDGRYFVQLNSLPYQKAVTWSGEPAKDIILIDSKTQEKVLIAKAETGNPAFSPGGRYVYWWSKTDSLWKTFDTQMMSVGYLGLWSMTKFHDEENDVPDLAGPHGIAGWLQNDEAAIVYDRYDMWKIIPSDPFNSKVITHGRASKMVHRYINLDEDAVFIDIKKDLFLHRFDESDKTNSYVYFHPPTGQSKVVLSGPYSLTKNVRKAKKSDLLVYTKENFQLFPDLLISPPDFSTSRQISQANPQQKDYGWGSNKLFTWKDYQGRQNEGMLFFPPSFDPEKQYPLIVNFYERSSDGLHQHRAPEAHRSTINYTYYTNQGYVIFNPDIRYTSGQPGEDCYNAVESGVDALLRTNYIDAYRMGLQGHSWGGYQVAYLLAKTDRYKCAESGAPVVNMVSAYGGIRWESGMSRMFQYEKTQSRIGATLWENPSLYLKNSPIFDMPKVKTPVLILHNDKDGAVPWYQ